MGRDQYIRGQIPAPVAQQGEFARTLDIRRQQHASVRRDDPEHATAIIVLELRIIIAVALRMKHFEAHAIPLPVFPGGASANSVIRPPR